MEKKVNFFSENEALNNNIIHQRQWYAGKLSRARLESQFTSEIDFVTTIYIQYCNSIRNAERKYAFLLVTHLHLVGFSELNPLQPVQIDLCSTFIRVIERFGRSRYLKKRVKIKQSNNYHNQIGCPKQRLKCQNWRSEAAIRHSSQRLNVEFHISSKSVRYAHPHYIVETKNLFAIANFTRSQSI